jgi:vancomycin permeability regulator SanA
MAAYGVREMVARNKDFWLARVIKPQPTFLGEAIPVLGDGGATDDK